MKKYILLLLLLLISPYIFSQNQGEIPNGISQALKTGNSKELVKYFNDNVEMVILDEEGIYSKTQAEMILKDFFFEVSAPKFFTSASGRKN